jgi:hypothetical protein
MRNPPGVVLVASLLVLGSSAFATAQSPSPASNGVPSDPERTRLETLCQERATTPDDLASCLDVVNRFLAPDGASASPSAAPVQDSVRIKGKGDRSSEAFLLNGGDYIATVKVKDSARDSIGLSCTARGSLKLTEDNSEAASVAATAPNRKSATVHTYVYGLDSGRYYWDFNLTSCGSWDVTLDTTVVDYSEPEPGPVVRSGVDTLDTEAFALTGGDYLVSSVLKAGAGDCDLNGYLIPVEEYSLFGSVGNVTAASPKRKQTKDETRLYSIEPGQYYWSVSTSSFALGNAACKWTLTLTTQ